MHTHTLEAPAHTYTQHTLSLSPIYVSLLFLFLLFLFSVLQDEAVEGTLRDIGLL